MVKKQLSSNLIIEKIIPLVVLLITLFLWIGIPEIPIVIPILALVFIIYCVYTIYFLTSNISYDECHFFIKDKKIEKAIELKNITQIKLTPYYGSLRNMWRIRFTENNQEKSVLLFLKYGFFSLNPFIKIVKEQNPSVDCVYIVTDLDFS